MAKTVRREILKNVKRVVIKIGSGVLTTSSGLNPRTISRLSMQISSLVTKGNEVIIVSSGAIAAGLKKLNLKTYPQKMPQKQAVAAVGQSRLIWIYEKNFKKNGQQIAQILLTHDVFSNRNKYLNTRNALAALLRLGVIPIINENDTVAVEEIRFGDNDTLSASVATLIEADLLLILTDMDGFFTHDPRINTHASLIPLVEAITPDIEKAAKETKSESGTGGMYTKLLAAKQTTLSGIPTIIANGKKKDIITRIIVNRHDEGTLFTPAKEKVKSRKVWIGYTLKPSGQIIVDDGAKSAIKNRGKSLLSTGIIKVTGTFHFGDAVSCLDTRNTEFARGLINYDSQELRKIIGRKTFEIENILGYKYYDEVIHRDDLVILK